MALPQYLQPQTYWEKRAALMEESVWRMANILANGLPPQYGEAISDHLRQWGELLKELREEHQAPPAGGA